MEKKEKICTCLCHTKGMNITHIMACCDYVGKSYINVDGSIDYDIYNKIKNENV